ncbi:MAG: hypothetical protein ACREGJ_02480 [Candidatus Saccharimonadales bacterium]
MNRLRASSEFFIKRRIAALSCFALLAAGCQMQENDNPTDNYERVIADCSADPNAIARKEYVRSGGQVAAFILGVTERASTHELRVKIPPEKEDDLFVRNEKGELTTVSPEELQGEGYVHEFPGGGSVQVTLQEGEFHLEADCS